MPVEVQSPRDSEDQLHYPELESTCGWGQEKDSGRDLEREKKPLCNKPLQSSVAYNEAGFLPELTQLRLG